MRVAVFGGTGFVGNYIIEELLQSGYDVNVLVREGSENKLDNIDKCNPEIQVQIFNLINACKGKNTKLVLTSSATLRDIDVFPDLQSRFAQMNSFTIKPLSEGDIVEAIAFISTKLDIQLSGDAIEYLKIFVRKDFYSIKQTVVELDKFLYAEKKQPSKQMVAKFLKKLKIT